MLLRFYLLLFIVILNKTSLASNNIMNIRWSDNQENTRLVIETQTKPIYDFKYNDNKLQVIVRNSQFKEKNLKNNINNHPINIKNITANKNNGTVTLNFLLKNKPNINNFLIPKNNNKNNFRIVFDIKPEKSKKINKIANIQPTIRKIEKVELIREDIPKFHNDNPKPIVENTKIEKIVKPKYKPIILLDAGHGGKDVGTKGASGVYEKNLTLKYCLELKKFLEARKKYKVYITRNKDEFLTLSKRVNRNKNINSDLFISIHADSHPDHKLRGLSIYTLSEKASDSEAATLAKHENDYEILSGIDIGEENEELNDVILDMIYNKKQNYSKLFAGIAVKELQKNVKLLNNSHRFANFKVLKSKNVPSILIELGYLSNPEEEKLLLNENYKRKIITSLSNAIDHYFNNYHRLN